MKSITVAAVLVQLMSSGGAGASGGRVEDRGQAGEVGKHFSALKNEVSALKEQYRAARERARLAAEQRKRESGEWVDEPATSVTAAPGRAAAPSGGAGTSAH